MHTLKTSVHSSEMPTLFTKSMQMTIARQCLRLKKLSRQLILDFTNLSSTYYQMADGFGELSDVALLAARSMKSPEVTRQICPIDLVDGETRTNISRSQQFLLRSRGNVHEERDGSSRVLCHLL